MVVKPSCSDGILDNPCLQPQVISIERHVYPTQCEPHLGGFRECLLEHDLPYDCPLNFIDCSGQAKLELVYSPAVDAWLAFLVCYPCGTQDEYPLGLPT